MTTAQPRERMEIPGSDPGLTDQHEIYYWNSPEEEPLVSEMTDERAIRLAVKATQARFRRRGVGEREVLGSRPAAVNGPEQTAAAKAAHNLLLGLLNNLSIDYPAIAGELEGYPPAGEIAMKAMDRASRRIARDRSLRATFEGIQDSYRKQFIGQGAVENAVS